MLLPSDVIVKFRVQLSVLETHLPLTLDCSSSIDGAYRLVLLEALNDTELLVQRAESAYSARFCCLADLRNDSLRGE